MNIRLMMNWRLTSRLKSRRNVWWSVTARTDSTNQPTAIALPQCQEGVGRSVQGSHRFNRRSNRLSRRSGSRTSKDNIQTSEHHSAGFGQRFPLCQLRLYAKQSTENVLVGSHNRVKCVESRVLASHEEGQNEKDANRPEVLARGKRKWQQMLLDVVEEDEGSYVVSSNCATARFASSTSCDTWRTPFRRRSCVSMRFQWRLIYREMWVWSKS